MTKLVEILQEGEKVHTKAELAVAIRALGEYRAAEAVGTLVRYLAFEPDPKPRRILGGPQDYDARFPAYGALIKIGVPAVDALVDTLASDADESRTFLADTATLHILGYGMRNAYLEKRLEKEEDESRRKRLRAYIIRRHDPGPSGRAPEVAPSAEPSGRRGRDAVFAVLGGGVVAVVAGAWLVLRRRLRSA